MSLSADLAALRRPLALPVSDKEVGERLQLIDQLHGQLASGAKRALEGGCSVVRACWQILRASYDSSRWTTAEIPLSDDDGSSPRTNNASSERDSNDATEADEATALGRLRLGVFCLLLSAVAHTGAGNVDTTTRAHCYSALALFAEHSIATHTELCTACLHLLTNGGRELAPFDREASALLTSWINASSGSPSFPCHAVLDILKQIVSFNLGLFQPAQIAALIAAVCDLLDRTVAAAVQAMQPRQPAASLLRLVWKRHWQTRSRASPADAQPAPPLSFLAAHASVAAFVVAAAATARRLESLHECLLTAQHALGTLEYVLRYGFFPKHALVQLIQTLATTSTLPSLQQTAWSLADTIFYSNLGVVASNVLGQQLGQLADQTAASSSDQLCAEDRACTLLCLLSIPMVKAAQLQSRVLVLNALSAFLVLVRSGRLVTAAGDALLSVYWLVREHHSQLFVEWDLLLDLLAGVDCAAWAQCPGGERAVACLGKLLRLLVRLSADLPFLETRRLASVFDKLALPCAQLGGLRRPLPLSRTESPSPVVASSRQRDLSPTGSSARQRDLSPPGVSTAGSGRQRDLSPPGHERVESALSAFVAFKASLVRPQAVDNWRQQLAELIGCYWSAETVEQICETVRGKYVTYRALHARDIEATVLEQLLPLVAARHSPAHAQTLAEHPNAAVPYTSFAPGFTVLPAAQRLIKALACGTAEALHLSKLVECLQFSPRLLKQVWKHRFVHMGGMHALFTYKRLVQCCCHVDADIRLPALRCLARFGVVRQLAVRRYSVSYRGRAPANSRVYWTRSEHASDYRLLPFDVLFNSAVEQIRGEQDAVTFQLLQHGLTTFLYNRYAMITGNLMRVASLAATNQARYLGLVSAAVGYHALLSREHQEDILRYYIQAEFASRKQVLYALSSAVVEMPQAARTTFQLIFNYLLAFNPNRTKNVRPVIAVIINLVEQGVASASHFPLLINVLLKFVDPRKYSGSSINAAYRAVISIFTSIRPAQRAVVCSSLLATMAHFAAKGCLYALAAADFLLANTPLEGRRPDLPPFDIPMLVSLESTSQFTSQSTLASTSSSSLSSLFDSESMTVTVRRASGTMRNISALQLLATTLSSSSTSPRALHITTAEQARALRLLDLVQPLDTHRIGVVLLAGDRPCDDEMSILSASVGSPRYQQLLMALGSVIPLVGLPGEFYSGGLDRSDSASDGQYALLWQDELTQVLFMVATLMPTHPGSVLNKKRHIGNCFVVVVYNESAAAAFKPDALPGQFNCVYIVVTPLEGSVNRVDVVKKDGLAWRAFGPICDTQVVSEEALALLVRQTALEADVIAKEIFHKADYLPDRAERMKQIRAIIDADHPSPPTPSTDDVK